MVLESSQGGHFSLKMTVLGELCCVTLPLCYLCLCYIAFLSIKLFFMQNTWFEVCCLAGLIITAFSEVQSLVYLVKMLCLKCIQNSAQPAELPQ